MADIPLASRLEGKVIDKWEVIKKRIKTPNDNSGAFSSCYEVKNLEDNKIGYLKAINYNYAFRELNSGVSSTELLQDLTANYNYEKDLLEFCKEKRMSHIVAAISHGEYREQGEIFPVPYLIFETATGSLKNIKQERKLDLAWKLGIIHGFLVGLSQLHQSKIVHQDIKPSNILIFGHNISKLADLGNATKFDKKSPMWDKDLHCGDWDYAPIELLYGYCSPNWDTRRLGADLFMAGGLITYLITDSNFLTLLVANLPDIYRPFNYGGSFENVKPHLMQAYFKTIEELKTQKDIMKVNRLIEVIAQLTHPIPEKRGLRKNIGLITSLPQYSLIRYISIIDLVSKKLGLYKNE